MSQENFEARFDAIDAQLKKLYRLCNKTRTHQLDPTGEKAAERSANCHFKKPQSITPELTKFLGLSKTDLISRHEFDKRIREYITENNLKDPEDNTKIILDKKLTQLFKPEVGDENPGHLSISKYYSQHLLGVPEDDKKSASPKRPSVKKGSK